MATPVEQLMERVTKLPLSAKGGILAGIVVVLTVSNYFLFVDDALTAYKKSVRSMQALQDKIAQNQQIAKNLNQYRKEKELLEQQLAKALTELPEEANIEGLIDSMNEMGTKAGLEMNTIEPKAETKGPGGLYAEIPLGMTVTGNFHELAVFFDSVRQLKRIVNITNIKLGHPRIKNEKVVVDASYTATAFRFVPQTKDQKAENK